MNILDDLKLQYKIGGITTQLIIWNVGLFLVSIPFFYQFKLGVFDFPDWVSLSSEASISILKPWTLVTHFFFHNGFFHLLFNMLILNFSARLFLTYFTQKQLLGLYLLAGIFSGIVFVLGFTILNVSGNIIGASAAIMAVLVGVTTYQPLMNIRLLLIGNVKLWHVTGVILLLNLLEIGIHNTGGHIAHFAGAFFGYLFISALKNGTDLSSGLSSFFDYCANIFTIKEKTPFKKVHRNIKPNAEPKKPTNIVPKDKNQQQIDEILDKISQSGYDSLSTNEKEFLFKAGK